VSETEHPRSDVVDQVAHLGAGFTDGDRRWVFESLESLVPHLARWDPAEVKIEISVKHRDGKEQQVTLQADLPRYPAVVAKVSARQLDQAIAEARRELVRQIEDEKSKREPKDNRHLREKPVISDELR
jgi:ribosome-associated translation inhibitor RaiA